jgi:hypothetical protein
MRRNINDLMSDGHGWRARLGVLTHDDSAISESELWTMAPDGVSLHTSRVFFADLATFSDPPGPENADGPLLPLLMRWTDGAWKLIPPPGTGMVIFGLAATSPANAWAVGYKQPDTTVILHWNGSKWS